MFIADDIDSPICDTTVNKILTLLGFLHICMQPYFCHVINASLTKNAKYIDRYVVIKRLCIIGGGMLFARHFLAPFWSTMDFKRDGMYASTEWLRGEKLCTFRYELQAIDKCERGSVQLWLPQLGAGPADARCALFLFSVFVFPFLSACLFATSIASAPRSRHFTKARHSDSQCPLADPHSRRRCVAVRPRTCAAARLRSALPCPSAGGGRQERGGWNDRGGTHFSLPPLSSIFQFSAVASEPLSASAHLPVSLHFFHSFLLCAASLPPSTD